MRTPAKKAVGCVSAVLLILVGAATLPAGVPSVNESAREIPVAYEVDVVVVGGGTGAVSAALSAAEAGAEVFLAAPHPYLGDDMTATLRLWLEDGEEPTGPLAEQLFHDDVPSQFGPDPNRLDFAYEADAPSAPVHKDGTPPRKLADGEWTSASSHSVQYDGDVSIVADLHEAKEIDEVRLMVFYRGSSSERAQNFKVQGVTIFTSDDAQAWKEIGAVENKSTEDPAVLSVPVGAKTRYVKLDVKKADDVDRILLGEIEIVKPGPATPSPGSKRPMPRPMHVKRTLDNLLLDAGVRFLYSCYATDVLRDAKGNPCGIVMANRAGRQAVVAKTIIDATDRATVARLAGAEFRPYPAGTQTFKRVVIGGELQTGENMTARVIDPPFRGPFPNPAKTSSGEFQVIEYTLELPMTGDTPASWAAAEQQARTMTHHPEQQFTSDVLFQIAPDSMHGQEESAGPWQGVDRLPVGAFRPAGASSLYVLGGCADVSREQAEKLLRPLALMDLGARLGRAAAAEAAKRPALAGLRVPGEPAADPVAKGDVGELLVGVRPIQELATVPQDARSLPVFGRYDVVVVGGGTGGAPAGIGAARQGAKTLVIEYLHGLGGVGTIGAISKYYWGNRTGFTATVPGGASWVIEQRMQWWRSQLLEAGADVWFGTIGCGAFVEDGQVKGAVVVTRQGRGVVLAHAVIDTTGNSDVAVAAGAESQYTDETEFGMQGTGLPGRKLGTTYTNTDFTIVDETDIVDTWHVFVYAKDKYKDAFDQGRLIDTRERRRILGEHTMTLLDQVLERTYPDTIEVAYSNFDSHGYTIDPYLELEHPGHRGFRINVPYRCLLPKGLEGILVGGLGMSAHRDAVPMTRMQPDIQNQGYAAGTAAAMAAKADVPLRAIDVRALQKHLIEIGNLPENVLTDEDSFPLAPEQVAAAVEIVKDRDPEATEEKIRQRAQAAAALVAHPDQALPLLRKAYQAADDAEAKLIYAHYLAVLGDATGLPTLVAEVERAQDWDEGWDYRGMGQFGAALSRLDQLVVALGRTRDPRAIPAIVDKAKLLTVESDFSHHRAVGLALELIGDSRAASPLAELLTQQGMTGYVHDSIEEARRRDQEDPSTTGVKTRRDSLRELLLARALYRCGDYGGVGKQTLMNYTKDLRGHLARHAKAVLEAGGK
ncbi:MAG TPA: FAD-dependent oxidoreductase [Thermoguttaceae bacterium]|nr:FAD-dependent oxidoreductase [Thermoguttaceae bacterium]